MKKMMGFVAVGQAGGNIGQLLEEKGYSVMYLNTSKEDLASLNSAKFKYHIKGGEGCAKDRNRAKRLLFEDYDQVAAEITNHINEPIICVIFSMGGGTGSGSSPALVEMLQDDIDNGICQAKCVMSVGILPALDERTRATINAHQCAKELLDIKGCGATVILDNGRNDTEKVNKGFVETLDGFLEVVGNVSTKGNIDKEEVIQTFRVNGNMMLLSGEDGALLESAESIYAPLDGLRGLKYITISSKGEYDTRQIRKQFGLPEEEFRGYNQEKTHCCLSGLPFPMDRFKKMEEKVTQEKEELLTNRRQIAEASLSDDLDFLQEAKKEKVPEKKQKSRREIMAKYMK